MLGVMLHSGKCGTAVTSINGDFFGIVVMGDNMDWDDLGRLRQRKTFIAKPKRTFRVPESAGYFLAFASFLLLQPPIRRVFRSLPLVLLAIA